MHPILLILFLLESIIFAVTGYLVGRKHTPFPDFRIGLHMEDAMNNRDAWESANRLCGLLCVVSAAVFLSTGLLLYFLKRGTGTAVLSLLGLSAVCIPISVLCHCPGILPVSDSVNAFLSSAHIPSAN